MSSSQKSLFEGMFIGFLVALVIFAGGIFLWIQVSSSELVIAANQSFIITVGGSTFDFVYHPDSHKFVVNGTDYPATVGFVGAWDWGRYKITKADANALVLVFKPWKFTSIQDVIAP
jgi:hypothetical protein